MISEMISTRLYSGRTPQARQSERRERLWKAGRRLFGTIDYQRVTVLSICKEAGLTQRYFYESYTNTESLFDEVHCRISDRIASMIAITEIARQAGAAEGRRGLLAAYFTEIRRDPVAARVFLAEPAGDAFATHQVRLRWQQIFGSLLMSSGSAPASELPAFVRNGLISALRGISAAWLEEGFATSIDGVTEESLVFAELFNHRRCMTASGIPAN